VPKVHFHLPDGAQTTVEAYPDMSVMEAALMGGVANILGTCGGLRSCATCHVIVDDAWRAGAGEPSQEERDLLEGIDGRAAGSRLGCQIKLGAATDGIAVRVPAPE
jgi:2Fe-2S ferredoxin